MAVDENGVKMINHSQVRLEGQRVANKDPLSSRLHFSAQPWKEPAPATVFKKLLRFYQNIYSAVDGGDSMK